MEPKLIDAHTHAQFAAFEEDAGFVIKRALDVGVWMVNVGTQKDTSQKAIEMAEKYPEGVYATVGLHPIHTDKSFHDEQELGGDTGFTSRGEKFDYEYYKKLAQHPKVVAIGECGFDYYRLLREDSKNKQEAAFIKQIELSLEIKKPLMIHCRQGFGDLIRVLGMYFSQGNSEKPGIIHFFSGNLKEATILLDMGFSFTFGGVITFSRDYDEIIKLIPHERILLETDAPYVAPAPYRGRRNEPVYLVEVAKKIAELKDAGLEEISLQTVKNTREILGI